MIYRRKCDLEKTPIEGCMSGKGAVWVKKLLLGPKEMRGKGRTYVCHTLNRGASIGTHTHENKMETTVIVEGKTLHTVNGRGQYLEEGDTITAQPRGTHEISRVGEEPLVLAAQVLFTRMAGHKKS